MSPLLPLSSSEDLPPVVQARPQLRLGVGFWILAGLAVVGVLLIPTLALGLLYHLENYLAPQPGDTVIEPFDRAAWLSNKSRTNSTDPNATTPRLRMCGAIARDPELLGLTFEEAVERFGPPSAIEPLPNVEDDDAIPHWMWSLDDASAARFDEQERGMLAWLVLRPDSNGRVDRVEIHSWLHY